MERLTRRQLVVRGGAVAGAAAFGSLAVAREANRSGPAVTAPPRGAARPLKGLALGGFGPLRSPHDPHDYLDWGNREFVRDSRTDVIRLQVSWRFLQPAGAGEPGRVVAAVEPGARQRSTEAPRPPDRRGQPGRRAGDPRPLSLLSRVVERDDARYCRSRSPANRPTRRLPLDLSPQSPWSWFVQYLCNRYGGPSRPHIWGLEICNEPNLAVLAAAGRRERGRRDGEDGGARRGGPPLSSALDAPRDLGLPGRGRGERGSRLQPGGPRSRRRCSRVCGDSARAARRYPRGRTTTTATPRLPTGAATAHGR